MYLSGNSLLLENETVDDTTQIIPLINSVNACVANGGWVLKDLGTETNNPNPRRGNTP